GDGDCHGSLREWKRDPECVERRSEQSEPAERGKQCDAGNRGRKDERQLDERDRDRMAWEPSRRQQVRGGRPEEDDQRLSCQARLQADDEGVADDRARELIEQVARCRVNEDRDYRQSQEDERHDRRRNEEPGDQYPLHCEAILSAASYGEGSRTRVAVSERLCSRPS